MKLLSETLGSGLSGQDKTDLQVRISKISNTLGIPVVNVEGESVLKFRDTNNEEHLFLKSWIKEDTISEGSAVNLLLNFTNLNSSDVDNIMHLLLVNGYTPNSKKITVLTGGV
jgi:hypothetical protein